jgi:hypothetical protein
MRKTNANSEYEKVDSTMRELIRIPHTVIYPWALPFIVVNSAQVIPRAESARSAFQFGAVAATTSLPSV